MTQQNTEVADIAAQIARLSEVLGQMTEAKTPPEKRRVISKMAKNVEHGDTLSFPDFGWGEVNCWVYHGDTDTVVLGAPGMPMLTFPGTQRVRVKRIVGT